jgi:hypothetical protein
VRRAKAANARARGDVFLLAAVGETHVTGAITSRGPLARRWARMKLDELLSDRAAATAHAMHYGLVSPYTSMVAIGDEVVVEGGVKHTISVPVSVPAGMRWQAVRVETTVDTTVSTEDANKVREVKDKFDDQVDGRKKTKGERARDDDEKKPATDDGDLARRPAHKPPTKRQPRPEPPAPPAPPPSPQQQPAQPSAPLATTPGGAAGSQVATKGDEGGTAAEDEEARAPARATIDRVGEVSTLSLDAGSYRRRSVRIAVAVGAGYASEGRLATGAIGGLVTRVEVGGRTMFGVDGSLWVVAGPHLQGELLGTIARYGIGVHWLELGVGLGLRIGDGVGPATAITLRAAPLKLRGFAVFGRYDGALRLHDATYDGENTLTGGVEARW